MAEPTKQVDLRRAINAVSEVVQNRPKPLREFDQIYMKTGDILLQSEVVAHWSDDKRLAFVGDGDAVSVAVAYLKARGVLDFGPSEITVFDFDERIVSAVKRFADKERLEGLDAQLYNVLDPFPDLQKYESLFHKSATSQKQAGFSPIPGYLTGKIPWKWREFARCRQEDRDFSDLWNRL